METLNTESCVTSDLAAFVSEYPLENIPEEAKRLTERAFVDTVGVTLAGAVEGAGKTTASTVRTWGNGSTTVIGQNTTGALPTTVFANATAGHGVDFDDVTWGMDGHPSVTMVAPVLALAEREYVSGEEAIAAYIVGFETQCYLAAPISPAHYERGWHATATFGTFGSTAASARLLGLSPQKTEHALNIAASMPAGLKRNFGSTTKPIHAGQAARSGVTAALLAEEGATADSNAIAGDSGFFDLYSGDSDVDIGALPALGERWSILEDGIHVKKYPCCYFTHSAIAATIDIVETNDLGPSDVREVSVDSSRGAMETLNHNDPDTGLEAKFSMPYCLGYAVVNRGVDLAAFDDENVDADAVREVQKRVRFDVDPSLEYDSNAATVEVTTADGDTHRRSRAVPPGHHTDPLSCDELHEKFRMSAQRAVSSDVAETAFERLNALQEQPDAAAVLKPL